jgi:hypothetical protein
VHGPSPRRLGVIGLATSAVSAALDGLDRAHRRRPDVACDAGSTAKPGAPAASTLRRRTANKSQAPKQVGAVNERNDRVERQSANLARHLNERYPDAVMFLARYAGGRPNCSGATVLTLAVASGAQTEELRLPFAPGDGSTDVRQQVARLLGAARAALPAGADVPLTSLEAQRLSGGSGHGR